MNQQGPVQLSLAVTLRDDATFANYYETPNNAQALHELRLFCAGEGDWNLLLWGLPGAGLTHLLQAVCHRAHVSATPVQYLPLQQLASSPPEQVCDGLDSVAMVCLDDVHAVCGHAGWEKALFHLYNRMRDRGHRLLMASHISPAALPVNLPDLKSRFRGSLPVHVHPMADADKAAALQMRAKNRGLALSDDVVRYILSHSGRNTADLFALLDRLDQASLRLQRRLTIPLVKNVMAES